MTAHRIELGAEIRPGVWAYRIDLGGLRGVVEGCSRQPLLVDRLAEARLFWPGRAEWALRCKIGWGAGHTVDEPGRRFAEWRQFDADVVRPAEHADGVLP